MSVFYVGFILGITGSLHCIGMCGPIALSIPIQHESKYLKFWKAFLYNSGRIITYSFFGLLFGLVGKSFALFGLQQFLSITIGVIILIWLFQFKKINSLLSKINFINNLLFYLRKNISLLFANSSNTSLLTIGILNGFLPCGLVYLAIVGATSFSSLNNSILFMFAFGIGTLPIMFLITILGVQIKLSFKQHLRKVYPLIMGIIACVLILRGMGLGIPYLSPKHDHTHQTIQGCCTKH